MLVETYCLVQKSLVPYVPTKPVMVQHLEGIGAVEIGNNYLYIQAGLFPKMSDVISKSVDLQDEVRQVAFHDLLKVWLKRHSSF